MLFGNCSVAFLSSLTLAMIGADVASSLPAQAAPRVGATAARGDQLSQRRYQLVVFGTFGGPQSYSFGANHEQITPQRIATGVADTALPDPFAPNFCILDCYVAHVFRWQDGAMTDLGGLPGGATTIANEINARGWVVGLGQTGLFDPHANFPVYHAVVWVNRRIVDLGTFGGNFSVANSINDRNQVVGGATNSTPDPYSFHEMCQADAYPTQVRAFIWDGGLIRNLGTLGGPDSCAVYVNGAGEIAGNSFTNFVPNPGTGFPTLDPFFWEKGKGMVDVGSLGGTLGLALGMNNNGDIAGISNLTGDMHHHPFLWSEGGLRDLGTLGGNDGAAGSVNDAGDVEGTASLAGDQTSHAFLWRHGVITDLGTVDGDPCSIGFGINSARQIVGTSTDCTNFLHAFLWERGQIIDLIAFVPPSAGITLYDAANINDKGAIIGDGVLANGENRTYALLPCHGSSGGCRGASDYRPTTVGRGARSRLSRSNQFPRRSAAWPRQPFGVPFGDPN
jgi:probable HAF family extracellular repeat protein